MLIIFQSGNFQNSTPVAVRVFKTGMLKLQRERNTKNARRREIQHGEEKEIQEC